MLAGKLSPLNSFSLARVFPPFSPTLHHLAESRHRPQSLTATATTLLDSLLSSLSIKGPQISKGKGFDRFTACFATTAVPFSSPSHRFCHPYDFTTTHPFFSLLRIASLFSFFPPPGSTAVTLFRHLHTSPVRPHRLSHPLGRGSPDEAASP